MDRRSDYRFDLPSEQIAQHPSPERGGSRLLVVDDTGPIDNRFRDIVSLLPEGACLVVNDTKVVPARLWARKATGGRVELVFVRADGDHAMWCMTRASKPIRVGATLDVEGGTSVVVDRPRDDEGLVRVQVEGCTVFELLDAAGRVPLPPYIERADEPTEVDAARYQTIFAASPGAVAAPTAGLHFTDAVLGELERRGVGIARVTLHVGPGTFSPLRVDDLDDVSLHWERYSITDDAANTINEADHVVAVGTTVVRTLESAATESGHVQAGRGSTQLFIRPGYRFRRIDSLVTNFHLPESSLLMLVCAFAGYERTMAAYRHAVAQGYRFFSYGDAMYIPKRYS